MFLKYIVMQNISSNNLEKGNSEYFKVGRICKLPLQWSGSATDSFQVCRPKAIEICVDHSILQATRPQAKRPLRIVSHTKLQTKKHFSDNLPKILIYCFS